MMTQGEQELRPPPHDAPSREKKEATAPGEIGMAIKKAGPSSVAY